MCLLQLILISQEKKEFLASEVFQVRMDCKVSLDHKAEKEDKVFPESVDLLDYLENLGLKAHMDQQDHQDLLV